MAEVLDRPFRLEPLAPVDERAARRSLLDQVERLETELSGLVCSTWPREDLAGELMPQGGQMAGARRGGPRILSLGELEELRDELSARIVHVQRSLSDRTYAEEQKRALIERMLLEPEAHRWAHVSSEDIGEPGCRHWHVRPRLGFLGMLMNWWRVVISSGCPLPAAG